MCASYILIYTPLTRTPRYIESIFRDKLEKKTCIFVSLFGKPHVMDDCFGANGAFHINETSLFWLRTRRQTFCFVSNKWQDRNTIKTHASDSVCGPLFLWCVGSETAALRRQTKCWSGADESSLGSLYTTLRQSFRCCQRTGRLFRKRNLTSLPLFRIQKTLFNNQSVYPVQSQTKST